MNRESVIKLSDKLLKRYEEPLDVIFLYNVEHDEIWAGNEFARIILELLDGRRSIKMVIDILTGEYPETSAEMLEESVITLLTSLQAKGMLTFVKK